MERFEKFSRVIKVDLPIVQNFETLFLIVRNPHVSLIEKGLLPAG